MTNNIFCRILCADFFNLSNLLRKEYFNSILASYYTASARRCVLFPLTLKKTRFTIYVHIWLPGNSACILKHKLTWLEQAVYRAFAWDRISVFYNSFKSFKTFIWLYVNYKWISNFWSKISNTFGSKSYLIWIGNSRLSLYWFQTALLIFLSLKILFIKAGFILFSVLRLLIKNLLSLLAYIVHFPASFRTESYAESQLSYRKRRAIFSKDSTLFNDLAIEKIQTKRK